MSLTLREKEVSERRQPTVSEVKFWTTDSLKISNNLVKRENRTESFICVEQHFSTLRAKGMNSRTGHFLIRILAF